MAVKNCAGYMSDDTAYNIKQLEAAKTTAKSEALDTDYSIKGKQMPTHKGEAS